MVECVVELKKTDCNTPSPSKLGRCGYRHTGDRHRDVGGLEGGKKSGGHRRTVNDNTLL